MHFHECRWCRGDYICGEDAIECFRHFITCDDCFMKHDARHFLLFVALLIVAIALTTIVFDSYKTKKEPVIPRTGSDSTEIYNRRNIQQNEWITN